MYKRQTMCKDPKGDQVKKNMEENKAGEGNEVWTMQKLTGHT